MVRASSRSTRARRRSGNHVGKPRLRNRAAIPVLLRGIYGGRAGGGSGCAVRPGMSSSDCREKGAGHRRAAEGVELRRRSCVSSAGGYRSATTWASTSCDRQPAPEAPRPHRRWTRSVDDPALLLRRHPSVVQPFRQCAAGAGLGARRSHRRSSCRRRRRRQSPMSRHGKRGSSRCRCSRCSARTRSSSACRIAAPGRSSPTRPARQAYADPRAAAGSQIDLRRFRRQRRRRFPCRAGAGQIRLSAGRYARRRCRAHRLHLRHDRKSERRAARPPGAARPPPGGGDPAPRSSRRRTISSGRRRIGPGSAGCSTC